MDNMDDVNHFEVLILAMLNALNDEENYLVPVESRNLDSYQARIAHNVILRSKSIRSKSNDPNPGLSMNLFFFAAIHVCQNLISSHSFADNHCRIMAIACDMFYRLDGSVKDRWGPPLLPVRCTEIWQLIPSERSEKAQLFLLDWEKQNSFLSHLVSRGYRKGLYLGLWEIGRALEHPIEEGCTQLMRCRVRVAVEWIMNCGDLLLAAMSDQKDSPNKAMRPGPIYGEGLPYLSPDRWEFWKKRLAEFQVKFHLHDETRERVAAVLELMQAPSECEKRNSSLERAIKEQLEIVATKERPKAT
ncbi:unnamed protein product [Clonostachys rhizophaga]|uniref:Uncharacterized protein n=1 Tax=Clonostachys rhizophaga TaxID=160324 RepID=A0A9N9YMG9_9HYPO|nr:unnamed protein product [Clonostachys rhizophaga]